MNTTPPDKKNISILYIEDNYDNRTLVRRILEAEGYRVLEADNATSALALVSKQTPDLILMDINIPDIDGYTLTSRFRTFSTLGHTPIIALTANVMKGDRERSLKAGCAGYIQKPIDVDTLPEQINSFLRH